MSPAVLPTPARPFGADTLACALALTGKATPTRAELTAALGLLNTPNRGGLEGAPPAGCVPTVNELLAAGWLVPTIDGRGLRVPPLSGTNFKASPRPRLWATCPPPMSC